LGLVAGEGAAWVAGWGIDTEDFCAQVYHGLDRKGGNGEVALLVWVKILAHRVGKTQSERPVEVSVAGTIKRRWSAAIELFHSDGAGVDRVPEDASWLIYGVGCFIS